LLTCPFCRVKKAASETHSLAAFLIERGMFAVRQIAVRLASPYSRNAIAPSNLFHNAFITYV
jgi:hypothetical protein